MSATLYYFARWPAVTDIFVTPSFLSVWQTEKNTHTQRHFPKSSITVVAQSVIAADVVDT